MFLRSISNGMDFGVLQIVPVDFVILFVLWIVFAVVALQGGRGEVVSVVLGAFMGVVLLAALANAAWVHDMFGTALSEPRSSAIIFIILTVLSYMGIRQMMLPYGSDLIGSPTQSAMLGFMSTIVLLALWVATPGTEALWQFSPLIEAAFSQGYIFFWLVIAFAMMSIFG